MVRSVPSPIATAIASDSFRLATLVLIILADGSTISLTDWDQALIVNLDGNGDKTYSPNKIEGLSTFSAQINAPIDDSDLSVIIDGSTFIADDVRRGVYDNATVTIGYVIPSNLANPWLHRKYDTAQASISGIKVTLELMGPEKRLEQPVGRTITVNCPWTFGSKDCGIQTRANAWVTLTAYALGDIVKRATGTGIYWFKATVAGTTDVAEPTWPATVGGTVVDGTVTWTAFRARRLAGTVSSSANRRTIVATGITVDTDYFGEGFVTFLTGANAGDRRRVKSDTGTGTLVLQMAAFDDIAIGDTFEALVGCRKRIEEDCIDKHDNEANSSSGTLRFGGFPFLAEEGVTATAPKG